MTIKLPQFILYRTNVFVSRLSLNIFLNCGNTNWFQKRKPMKWDYSQIHYQRQIYRGRKSKIGTVRQALRSVPNGVYPSAMQRADAEAAADKGVLGADERDI